MDIAGFADRFLRRGCQNKGTDEEEVIFLVRKHLFFLLRSLFLPLTLLVFLLLLNALRALDWIVGETLVALIASVPLPVYLIVCFALVFWLVFAFIEWENDYLLLTNRRVICQMRVYKISEETIEAELGRIQDIDIRVLSPLASLLGYGDIIISTAGIGGELIFTNVASPEEVKALIFAQIEQIEELNAETHRQSVKEKLEIALGYQRGPEQ